MESEDEQEETLQTTPESEDFLTDYLIEGDGIPLYIDDSHDASGDHDPADIVTIPSNGDEGEPPSLLTPASHDRVIRSLLGSGHVSEKQVQQAIADWQAGNGREALWRILGDQPEVNKEAVYEEAARVYAFKQEQIGNGRPDFDFVLLTMQTVAEDQREELLDLLLLPFEHVVDYETGVGRMIFVTPDPTHPEVSRLLHELDLGRFELKYAPESEIRALLEELFPRKNEYLERISTEDTAFDFGTSYEDSADLVDEEALDAEIKRSKLINLFEATLVEATRMGASDIHIYPNPKRQVEIHFRLDGRLKHWHTEKGIAPEAFLSVVKDNSTNVDRFERDAAQDGYIQRRIDDALIRFRVSILPIATANQELRAESIVIRILDDRKVLTELDQLGMLDVALERFDKAIRQPHGMVILTGPTGSGKSTTLVAALYQVVTSEVNVLSVEDPVEYIINGVRQIKLSHKLNLESALRSILRHDPDIVMVGEMRDHETAELAIKLANTGHLTFSTLHTNDAPAAVSRLYKMGVEPFLIAYAINLVVAQRLIRTVCPTCKAEDKSPDKVLMKSLGWTDKEIEETTVYKAMRGGNCATCSGIGYKGRRAICETLYFSDKIRHIIAEAGTDIDEGAIRKIGIEEGMLTLMESAKRLVEMGETTLDEMLRTTGAE
ncbi:MAG: type II/IV secretion system protein [Bacteroidetes bacterium]|nr:type II/IV secretion system protein [Bacteroidota bacterium]